MLRTLGRAVASPLLGKLPSFVQGPPPPETLERTLPSPPADLVEDFLREMGGDPARWRGVVPPHLFPQWGLPLAGAVFRTLRYPMHRMLNASCRLELRKPLPAGEPLHVTARVAKVDDDGKRARIHGLITTGTASAPEALVAFVEGYVPLPSKTGSRMKERPMVPKDARQIAEWRLGPRAGLDFALLTGDFNPLHWIRPYARLMGFKSTLAHGYALMGRALEAVVEHELNGDPSRLAALEVRFTAPTVLPAAIGLFVGEGDAIWMGKGPGATANIVGSFQRRSG
ncbi:MAG TPA: MaoC/PaaZ C-terminal domain-containing protein [Myxococcales bacterium]